jgi:hypothetical protein
VSISAALDAVEAVGIVLRLDGEKVRISYPDEERREELAERIDFLRDHKDEVLSLLRRREEIPAMPQGVRLVHWEPKSAPVVLTHYSVVTDVDGFIRMTLLELKAALDGKRWQAGHRSVRELVDRLEQCGVSLHVSGVEARSKSGVPMPQNRD